MIALLRSARALLRRLAASRDGNVLMLMVFSVIPLTLAGGIGIDYARAARLQTKLNAAADAASLAAVSQPMMLAGNDNAKAKTAAENMFKSQITSLPGLVWNDANLVVNVTGNDTATNTRTAVVTYTAASTNAFSGIIGMTTIAIGGTATATATAAPNIDFYLALDTSSSMALPTESAGFTVMDNAVECAFACHSNKIQQYVGGSIPTLILDNAKFSIVKGTGLGSTGSGTSKKLYIDSDNTYIYENRTTSVDNCKGTGNKDICIYNSDGTYVDSYWYALNKGVRLRVTDERTAAADLMTTAKAYALANSRTYRAALYTFDHSTNLKTLATLTSNLDSVKTKANDIDVVTVNDQVDNGCPPTSCTNNNKYLFTSFKSVMDKLLAVLPTTSGQGTNTAGDTPQAFVFLVTDGMSDEDIGSGRTRAQMQQDQLTQCTTIKNRGIKIAILYTEYTVESIQDDEPNQRAIAEAAIPNIAPALTQCASPDLMYTVKTDQSITDALQALFTKAVASARLTN